jgi:carbon storage regulator
MLVLTRGTGQQIIIDGNIRVTVLGVRGEKVRLGIEAPPSIPVHRQEIHERYANRQVTAELEFKLPVPHVS